MVADKFETQGTDRENQGFFQKLATAGNRIPLRTVLIVTFILQIFGTVGIVGYISFRNSQAAVEENYQKFAT